MRNIPCDLNIPRDSAWVALAPATSLIAIYLIVDYTYFAILDVVVVGLIRVNWLQF